MAYESEIEKLQRRYDEKPEQWFAALADAYRKADRLDDALDIVRIGIDDRPNYVSGHIVLGRCLVDRGDDAEAQVVFERVLGLDAENIIALRMLADVSERRGDLRGAGGWLQRLLDIDPMNDEARDALTRIEASAASAPPARAPADPDASSVDPGSLAIETVAEMAGVGSAVDDEAGPELETLDLDGPDAGTVDRGAATGPAGTVKMSPPADAVAEADRGVAEPPVSSPAAQDDTGLPSFDLEPAGLADDDEDDGAAVGAPAPPPVTGGPDLPPPAAPPPAKPPEEKPFIIRQSDNPFGPAEHEPASFDAVLPDNQGGVFGVNQINFDSDTWKSGARSGSEDSELPVGEQEVSLDSFDSAGGVSLGDDVGMPTKDREISLDAFAAPAPAPPPPQAPPPPPPPPAPPAAELPPPVEWDAGERTTEEVTRPIPAVGPDAEPEPVESLLGDLPEVPTGAPELTPEAEREEAPSDLPWMTDFDEADTTEAPAAGAGLTGSEAWPEPSPGLEPPLEISEAWPEPAAAPPVAERPPEVWPEPVAAAPAEELEEVWPEPALEAEDGSAVEAAGVAETWPEPSPGFEPPDLAMDEPAAAAVAPSSEDGGQAESGPTRELDPAELAAAIERSGRLDRDPEPPVVADDMVTETMAEVYARQGLISEARAVYEQLIEANPLDKRLREKLERLNASVSPARVAEVEAAPGPSYRASKTGAMPVRAFLANVLAARPGPTATALREAVIPEVTPTPPMPTTPMEEAFGAGEEDETGGEPGATDDTSLAQVFDQENPAGRDVGPAQDMSFDQFFRTDPEEPDQPTEDKGDDEDFKAWLQGLKS